MAIGSVNVPGKSYSPATQSSAGLMSATDKTKLDGIATGANNYTHPSHTAQSSGLYKVTVDNQGHVSGATAVQKSDITALGIPGQDTTYSAATTSAAGLMSAADKTKLDGIDLSGKLDKSGGTMSGNIAMGSNRITGLAAGVNDTDAVSKGQLDTAVNQSPNRYLRLGDLGTFANGTEWQSYYTSSGMKADISSGTFQKALTGCKVTINGHVYYFAHPDYWYRTGDTECTTHHMLVVPAGNLSSGQMNRTNITTGAYIGSNMYTGNNGNTALADAKAIIRADFGAANILTHREHFQNAVTGDYESAGTWYDSDIDLMTERMVYGCDIFHNCVAGTNWANRYTIDKSQIKLFAERPDLITTRANWWLRDVAYAGAFAYVDWCGPASNRLASNSDGVRPAFGIC